MSYEENKMEMPNLIKIPILLLKKEANENLGEKKEYVSIEARINPFYITSYYSVTIGDEGRPAVSVAVSGSYFYVDMNVEDFDKLLLETDRAVKINTKNI